MEIIGETLYPHFDLELSPHEPNRSNPIAAHRGDLMAGDMFGMHTHARAAPVVGILLRGQRLMAIPFPVNFGAQLCGL